jgi:hypothetical protein
VPTEAPGYATLGSVPTFVLGDLHGHFGAFVRLLDGAGLIDAERRWSGGDATLILMGDLVDRGPEGLACVDLAMRLEREAPKRGGRVVTLMGNHELVLLAAYAFPDFMSGVGQTFRHHWLDNGGVEHELAALTPEQARWLRALPAMVRVDDTLFVHADSEIYLEHGRDIGAVDAGLRRPLAQVDPPGLDRWLAGFGQHGAFEGRLGEALLEQFLRCYGGERLVHGHTPISLITGVAAEGVAAPRTLHGGRCINVDGGIFLGGPGFVWRQD